MYYRTPSVRAWVFDHIFYGACNALGNHIMVYLYSGVVLYVGICALMGRLASYAWL